MQQYNPNQLSYIEMRSLAAQRISVEVSSFRDGDWHKKVRSHALFIITKNSADFPGKYAVRMFDLSRPTCLVAVRDTLEEARKTIPLGWCGFKRSKKDDPAIVETWM